jgi:hypothetical protein
MKSKNKYYMILLLLSLFMSSKINAQQIRYDITDKLKLDSAIMQLITPNDIIDTSATAKLVFAFKIDSLGEVRSAHIRWSDNIKNISYYNICMEIELNFNLIFLYNQYKKRAEYEKFAFIMYPISLNKP